jgi:hypothetical protein
MSSACTLHAQAVSPSEAIGRAKKLVAQMTLDEKISQLHGIHDPGNFRIVPGIAPTGDSRPVRHEWTRGRWAGRRGVAEARYGAAGTDCPCRKPGTR